MRQLRGLVMAMVLVGAAVARADEEDAVRVYKQLQPSVVSLQNLEGSGTGIIVNARGLILTNAHVVNSPLPFTVKVAIGKGPELTFNRVQIVGYHPRLDLALVKIDPAEQHATLVPVTISKVKADPGQRIFAIGNPGAGGMILTRTITSGMISGVDRVVDGEKYYQTDAAINPGNSGGPICDRTGKVLGLVTFKFTDVQATGFAIPLHDVDLNGFAPITARKSDPAQAAELSRLAEKYAAEADRVGRVRGMNDAERKQLNGYAAILYHMALTLDPTNAAIYYNTGMLLQRLGENEVGAGYLARAVVLEPWDKNTSNPYRELGLALIAQKKEADAIATWREGLAKHPYAVKIWEDLAVTFSNGQKYPEATTAAATALLIDSPDTRVVVLQRLMDDARGHVTGAAAKTLDEQIAPKAIVASLDKLLADSNTARKQRKVWVTPAFAQLMKTMGGEPVSGVEKAIPSEPIPRLAVLSQYTGSAAQAAASGKPTVRGNGTTPGGGGAAPTPADSGAWAGAASTPKPAAPDSGAWAGGSAIKGTAAKPEISGKSLAGTRRTVVDALVTPVLAEGVVSVAWSNDAASAFILQKDGLLHKVAVADLVESRSLSIGSPCGAMARAKPGLVVALTGLQEVWLLNEDLELLRRVPIAGVKHLVASPLLPYAFASNGQESLYVIDLGTGAVREFKGKDFENDQRGIERPVRVAFWHMNICPDGRYLLVEGNNTDLMRLRITGGQVRFDAASTVRGSNPDRVEVSGDSRYTASISGGGNEIEGMPRTNYATYVFAITDLNKPVTIIDSGAYPRALGFDPVARTIYAQNHEKQLIVFTGAGLRAKEYKFGERNADVHQFVVHPNGYRLFAMTEHLLYWVELPGRDDASGSNAPGAGAANNPVPTPAPSATTKPAAAADGDKPPVAMRATILSARWGGGKNMADVTPRVIELITKGEPVWVNTKSMGIDPTPGWRKHLEIKFEKDGKKKTLNVDEDKKFPMAEFQ